MKTVMVSGLKCETAQNLRLVLVQMLTYFTAMYVLSEAFFPICKRKIIA